MSVFWQVLYFLTAGLMLSVAVLVFVQRPYRSDVRAFAAFLVAAIGWLVSLNLFYVQSDAQWLILDGRFNFVFVQLTILLALLFVHRFPDKSPGLPRWLVAAMSVGVTALAVVTATTDLVDQYEETAGFSRVIHYGQLFWMIAAFSIVIVTTGVYAFWIKRHIFGKRVIFFGAAWSAGVVVLASLNTLAPFIAGQNSLYAWGPVIAAYFTVLFIYVMARRGILDLRLLFVQVLIACVILLFSLNLALSITVIDQVIGAASLVVGMVLSYLLLRTFHQEVKRRRQVEQMADELRQANKYLEEASETKSEFIDAASHQLRTPVSVMKGLLSLVRDGAYGSIEGALRDKMDQMFEMNERLIRLIGNLLNITRLEKGRVEYSCSELDVDALISQVRDEVRLEAASKGLNLEYREPALALPMIWADSDKLYQVLVNLVDNAIKYTPSGRVTIAASFDEATKRVIVRITDTGIGMQEKDLRHVFDKYFRPSSDNETRQAGMSLGLGLYICAKFMRGMGGDIHVEHTSPGQGTTMAVYLPIEQAEACAPKPPAEVAA